jgi:hypothetical protein
MNMPLEIWDNIFSVDSGLALQDHIAMSGTCKQIRKAYTVDVWKAFSLHPFYKDPIVNHIFSSASISTDAAEDTSNTSIYKEEILNSINRQTINLTSARSTYKVTEKEIMSIPFEEVPNPHGRRLAPMKLFRVARVRALALRVHGGLYGHQAHLRKLAEKSAKAKETRKKNGTLPVKKYHAGGHDFTLQSIESDLDDGEF